MAGIELLDSDFMQKLPHVKWSQFKFPINITIQSPCQKDAVNIRALGSLEICVLPTWAENNHELDPCPMECVV